MSKEKEGKVKSDKKNPAKNLKEKRADKVAKRKTKERTNNLVLMELSKNLTTNSIA